MVKSDGDDRDRTRSPASGAAAVAQAKEALTKTAETEETYGGYTEAQWDEWRQSQSAFREDTSSYLKDLAQGQMTHGQEINKMNRSLQQAQHEDTVAIKKLQERTTWIEGEVKKGQ
eukprot:14572674-Alexandrium_andersonii.AAC.1